MYPVLLDFGKIHLLGHEFWLKINTYGFMMAIGLLAGIFVTRWQAKQEDLNVNKITDAVVWAFILNFIGGRILFILSNIQSYIANPSKLIRFGDGGFVFYGGLVAAILVFTFFIRRYKLPLAKSFDAVAPGIAIGHVFGRIGCFFAGCCHGKLAPDCILSVTFSNPLTVAPRGVPLYPTQLFDALNALIVFGILLLLRKYKKFDGQIFLNYLILYSVGRIIVEMFRGDSIRGFVVHNLISTSQLVAALIIAASGAIYYRLAK
jgi:phosphatidylglycerol---prolipoprotein diacylglyceryl transferase